MKRQWIVSHTAGIASRHTQDRQNKASRSAGKCRESLAREGPCPPLFVLMIGPSPDKSAGGKQRRLQPPAALGYVYLPFGAGAPQIRPERSAFPSWPVW